MENPTAFETERKDNLLIVMPKIRISELAQANIATEYEQLLEMARDESVKRILVDFQTVDFFGSAMLEILLALRKQVGDRPDSLALCSISEPGRDVLRIARFHNLCNMYDSREDYFGSN